MGAPILLLIVLLVTSWLVDRTPGAVAPDFSVAVPAWHDRLLIGLSLAAIAATAMLFISSKYPVPRQVRWFLVALAMAAAVIGVVGCRLVAEAHLHAGVRGPRHPMLLASTSDCGGGRSRRPGPCVHSFRLWDGHGAYDVQGKGLAKVRACVMVQRVADRTGFIWDEVVAEQDLLRETDDAGDITQQAQRDCVNGVSL